ncbi:MAG: NAD(P)H-dependent oxidoreductase [Pseudomonadota bacterium]
MSKVAIIVGSHRKVSQSLKIGKMMNDKLSSLAACDDAVIVNLADADLPYWSESYSDSEKETIATVKNTLLTADAFIVITPEWNGMVPSQLKNLFLLYSTDVFAHKPALITSISAGIGGSYPINELRTSSYKNSRICYLPEHLIFRHVTTIFNHDGENDEETQDYMSGRTDYCLDLLMLYSNALKSVREAAPASTQFSNGM